MALLPYLLNSEIHPRKLHNFFGLSFDDDFDDCERPLLELRRFVRPSRPWRNLKSSRDVESSIKSDKDKFQINVDVQHFAPEEISVKTSDGFVIIEGKHEEKQDDHGYISRQFKRRFLLPEGCNPETIESKLSTDGVLTVVAPKTSGVKGERAIPITHTGPVRRKNVDEQEPIEQASEINGAGEEETKSPQKKRRR